jgi:hypothetical protein
MPFGRLSSAVSINAEQSLHCEADHGIMPSRKQRTDQQQAAVESKETTMKPENESTSNSQAGTTASDKAEQDLSAVNPFDPNRFRRKTLAAAVVTRAGLTKGPLVKKAEPGPVRPRL